MTDVYLSLKQFKLLEEFYKGRVAKFFEKEKIYLKDRWAFVGKFDTMIKYIDGKTLKKLINDGYVEIFEEDGYKKMRITKKGKSLVFNNHDVCNSFDK